MMTSTMFLLAVTALPDYDRTVDQMIRDAQATNAALVRAGTMQFDISQTLKGKEPARIVGTFSWKDDSGFWSYRLSDPDHTLTARESFSGKIEDAPVEYMLLAGDKIYSYSAASNLIHLNRIKNRHQISTAFFLFDMFPTTLWDACCPPNQTDGRPWAEMMGPNSAASSPESTHELARIGDGIYRYVRVDQNRGKAMMDYSMTFAGHPTSVIYDALPGKYDSLSITYEWQMIGKAVVLRACESKKLSKNDRNDVLMSYSARLDQVDVTSPVSSSKFSFEDFARLLPKNAGINDHITLKRYPLHKSSGPSDEVLKNLSKQSRSSGFANPEKP